MKSLKEIFDEHKGYSLSKWSTYLTVYNDYFEKYRGKKVTILEIGINYGGSLQVWQEFFGHKARIIGVDIFEGCKNLELNAEIFIGSQADRHFLRDLKSKIPKVDILIDDGGHSMRQQIITFEEMFDHVKEEGIYVCEDVHTSYWRKYGGGFRRRGTFMEYSKKLIDKLNANHSKQASLRPDYFTRNTHSLHFFDSLILIQKGVSKNKELSSGVEKLHEGYMLKRNRFKEIIQSIVDRVCVFLRLKDPYGR